MENFKPSPLNNETVSPKKNYLEDFSDFEGLTPAISRSELLALAETDPILEKPIESFLKYAERYAFDVWNMNKNYIDGVYAENPELLAEEDDKRTILHTALTDSVRIIIRAMNKSIEENGFEYDRSWISELVDSSGDLSRSACGNLAIVLEYQRYLDMRDEENINSAVNY